LRQVTDLVGTAIARMCNESQKLGFFSEGLKMAAITSMVKNLKLKPSDYY
jgi:hypothetical protein